MQNSFIVSMNSYSFWNPTF